MLVLKSSIVQNRAGSDRESCLQALGLRLAWADDRLSTADPNIDSAGDDTANSGLIDNAQIAIPEGEIGGLGSAGIEMDALESSERAHRTAIGAGVSTIQMNNSVACDGTGVCHTYGSRCSRVP